MRAPRAEGHLLRRQPDALLLLRPEQLPRDGRAPGRRVQQQAVHGRGPGQRRLRRHRKLERRGHPHGPGDAAAARLEDVQRRRLRHAAHRDGVLLHPARLVGRRRRHATGGGHAHREQGPHARGPGRRRRDARGRRRDARGGRRRLQHGLVAAAEELLRLRVRQGLRRRMRGVVRRDAREGRRRAPRRRRPPRHLPDDVLLRQGDRRRHRRLGGAHRGAEPRRRVPHGAPRRARRRRLPPVRPRRPRRAHLRRQARERGHVPRVERAHPAGDRRAAEHVLRVRRLQTGPYPLVVSHTARRRSRNSSSGASGSSPCACRSGGRSIFAICSSPTYFTKPSEPKTSEK